VETTRNWDKYHRAG